jgi:hypothetical protein
MNEKPKIADHCTRDGAEALRARIQKYWADQGQHVETVVIQSGHDNRAFSRPNDKPASA